MQMWALFMCVLTLCGFNVSSCFSASLLCFAKICFDFCLPYANGLLPHETKVRGRPSRADYDVKGQQSYCEEGSFASFLKGKQN